MNLRQGVASLEATDVPITDFGTITNALSVEPSPTTPGTVSFKVVWQGVDERFTVRSRVSRRQYTGGRALLLLPV